MSQGNAGKGRAKGSRNRRTAELLALAGSGESPVEFCLRISRDVDQPLDVRLNAARTVMPFIHPKPMPEPRTVIFDLPETNTPAGICDALGALLTAAASGQLAPAEAKELGSVLDARLKAFEVITLEERIAKLEARSLQ